MSQFRFKSHIVEILRQMGISFSTCQDYFSLFLGGEGSRLVSVKYSDLFIVSCSVLLFLVHWLYFFCVF